MLNTATAEFFGTITKIEFGDTSKPFARITIPITDTWIDKDGQPQEKTNWLECVAFGKLVETFQKLDLKGRYVRVQANIKISESELEGKKITTPSFVISDLQFLDKKPE